MLAGVLGGCSSLDSYMDPSVLGRWEYTPTTVPVLTYISSIEDRPQDLLEYSKVSTEDLLPNPSDYRFGPGDRLEIKVLGIVAPETKEEYQRVVDIRGLIDIPQLGRFYVNGRNGPQVKALIADAARKFTADPLVELDVLESRQQTFSIVGGVDRPGTYLVPSPDFRALHAVGSAGRLEPSAKYLDVIRIVTLDPALDEPSGPPPSDAIYEQGKATPSGVNSGPNADPSKAGQDLLDAIDAVSGDKKPAAKPSERPSPALIHSANSRAAAERQPGNREPVIDLPEPGATPTKPAEAAPAAQPATDGAPNAAPWVFVNGRWAQVKAARAPGGALAADGSVFPGDTRKASEIVTQRVIRIPRDRLEAGDSSVNIIIRPGDVLRVPEPLRGVFYVGGQVRRGGSFVLPEEGRMTIRRAIDTAGGLDALAWPERAELIRSLGEGRQAIVSFNLRAIAEGTQPDIYVKPDDQINIGTSFWATPLAVLRNGLRASYGFGFLLDRNFGTDVFGLPPEYKTRARSALPF